MGRLVSVYSDRAFDALRNPALMSQLDNPNQIGINITGRVFQDSVVKAAYDEPASEFETVFSKVKTSIGGSVYFAVTSRAGKGIFGIGLSTSELDQVNITETEDKALAFDLTNGLFFYSSANRTLKYSPALVISYSIATTSRSSLGFQITTGYTRSLVENNEKMGTQLNGFEETFKREIITTMIPTECSIGYAYRHDLFDIGFMLGSGELTFRKDRFKGARRNFTAPTLLDFSMTFDETRSFYPIYTGGVTMILGAYVKPLRFFGVAAEAAVTSPVTYRFTRMSASRDIPKYVEKQRTRFHKDLAYTVKAGVDFTLAGEFIFSAGFLYSGNTSETSYRGFKSESENTTYGGTFGFDYRIRNGAACFIAAQVQSIEQKDEENIRLLNQFRIASSVETVSINLNAGASFGFN